MKEGWICLYRSLLDWEWYSDINTTRLWIHCLARANYEDVIWRGHGIKRGQFLTSLENLSKETCLSVQQLRTSIKKLESTGNITSNQQARARVITVLCYDDWQDTNKPSNRKSTGNQQAGHSESNSKSTTDNNITNKQINNNNISVENPKPKTKRDFPHWKLFFDAYPENKKGAVDTSAWKAAKRLNLDDNDFELMHADVVQRTKANPEWYSTYALGITRYIGEQFWKTPIDKKQQAKGAFDDQLTDEQLIDQLDPKIAEQLRNGSNSNSPRMEAGSIRGLESMVGKLPQAAPKRDG